LVCNNSQMSAYPLKDSMASSMGAPAAPSRLVHLKDDRPTRRDKDDDWRRRDEPKEAEKGSGKQEESKKLRRWQHKPPDPADDTRRCAGSTAVSHDPRPVALELAGSATGPPVRSVAPGTGAGRGGINISRAFAAGVRIAYMQRYVADLERLAARPDLSRNARWFDSHCHLESILQRSWRGGGKPQVLENEPLVSLQELVESWPAGLEGCVANFVFKRQSKPGNPSEWVWIEQNLHAFAPDSPIGQKLWFTIGLHPHDARNWDSFAEKTVRRFSAHPKCVGIGECGLDFFKHDKQEAELQLHAFRAQAKLAVELGKALVVHGRLTSREYEEMCLRELENLVPSDHPIHIHCYSDSLRYAHELMERWPNLRFGFTGAITFRDAPKGAKGKGKAKPQDSKKGQEHCKQLVQGLPLERLLIETDGPYMCPEPFRGQTAHPGHVHRVAEQIAEWKNVTLEEVMAATWQSTVTVYLGGCP